MADLIHSLRVDSSEDMAIGVIVAVRNQEKYLPECLESILSQKINVNWQLIIVDDGSLDETPEIIKSFGSIDNVVCIRTPGVGLAAAANLGIKAAKAKWIVRVDSDDLIYPGALRQLYMNAETSRRVLVYPDYFLIDENSQRVGIVNQKSAYKKTGGEHTPIAAGCLFRRSMWASLGGYDEKQRYQEDFDFWLRIEENYQVHHLAIPLYGYRQLPASMSTNILARSIARRDLKRSAVIRRKIAAQKSVVRGTIIDPRLNLTETVESETVLSTSVLDKMQTLLGQINEADCIGDIDVITTENRRKQVSAALGISCRVLLPTVPDIRASEFQFFADRYAKVSTITVFLGLCAVRLHRGRMQEIIDTVMLSNCKMAASVAPIQKLNYASISGLSGEKKNSQRPDSLFVRSGDLFVVNGICGMNEKREFGYLELTPAEVSEKRDIVDSNHSLEVN